ncbi:MAG TPA: trigger factor [Steroidobacteraceae bacterium]|nr:trigger factor [Steroidobacteraceae bacterium]
MQVSVQSTGGLEKRMQVELPADEVERTIDEELTKLSRTARLNGFRPGKAPMRVVRQQFGARVRKQVVDDLLRSSFQFAASQQKLVPVGDPRIEALSSAKGKGLKYAAVFEVLPQIELKSVEGLEIERLTAAVAPGDIDVMIESLRKQRPKWVEAARPARDGDKVTVDFDGKIDGAAFAGGKGENVEILIGANRMLREFEQGVLGASAGETKAVTLTFRADYHYKEVAGKTAAYDIRILKVEEATPPDLDEAFFKSFGIEEGGLDALRRDVAENMERELATVVRARVKTQLLNRLHDANPVEVPRALVENQIRQLQIDAARRMGVRDVSQIPAREQFEQAARRRVGLGLLINEIIRREGIRVDRAKVDAEIAELVAEHEQPGEMARAYLENREAMHQIETRVLEDQVVEWLIGRARITDKPVSFHEAMNSETKT